MAPRSGRLLWAATLWVAATACHLGVHGVVRVPQDAATIQAAVAMAHPGDLILIAPGTYTGPVSVPASKPGLTIRGLDRNRVVIDGLDRVRSGFVIAADR